MASKGSIRTAVLGSLIGIVAGLLVIFVIYMGILTAPRPAPDAAPEAKAQRSFMALTRDDWSLKLKDPEFIRGYISVVQARANDLPSAQQNIDKLTQLDKNIVRNVSVYDILYYKVRINEEPKEEVIQSALKIAKQIDDPLLRADALRRIAEVQETHHPKEAQETLKQAAKAIDEVPVVPIEKPSPLNIWVFLWPAGLAVFGFLFAWLTALVWGSLPASAAAEAAHARSKVKEAVAEEEEDEDEEEDEEEEAAAELLAAAPPPAPAPAPPPPAPPPPLPAAPPVAETKPSLLSKPAAAPAAGAAPGKPAVPTMMAKQGAAAPTMLSKQGPAAPTQLAKQGPAAPTQLAKQAPAKPTMVAPPDQVPPAPPTPPPPPKK